MATQAKPTGYDELGRTVRQLRRPRPAPKLLQLESSDVLSAITEGKPIVGSQIVAPATTIKSYEDFFLKKMRKKIGRKLQNCLFSEGGRRILEFSKRTAATIYGHAGRQRRSGA